MELVWKSACQKGRYIRPLANPRETAGVNLFWRSQGYKIGKPRIMCNSDHHAPHVMFFPKTWMVI